MYIYLYIYEWKDAIRLGGESGVGHNALKYIQKTPGLLL